MSQFRTQPSFCLSVTQVKSSQVTKRFIFIRKNKLQSLAYERIKPSLLVTHKGILALRLLNKQTAVVVFCYILVCSLSEFSSLCRKEGTPWSQLGISYMHPDASWFFPRKLFYTMRRNSESMNKICTVPRWHLLCAVIFFSTHFILYEIGFNLKKYWLEF